jgi:hypothetical protein
LSVPDDAARDPAAQIHLPLIDQAAQAQGHGFFVAGEGALMPGDPGHLAFCDHAADQRLKEDLSNRHESHVTNSLHSAVLLGVVRHELVGTEDPPAVKRSLVMRTKPR